MEEPLQYLISADQNGNPLEGSKNYDLHLPPGMSVHKFWSIIVYDDQSRLIIQTDQSWPSIHSQHTNLLINPDGSLDVFFGPIAPENLSRNWIKTITGKAWYLILRLYLSSNERNIDKWEPGEVLEIK